MGGYIGITDDYPVYETQIVTENITPENIQDNFTVKNSSYYFVGNGDVFTSNNKGINNSTAETTLTALYDMSIEFMYSYSSESNYDKFTLIVGNTTVESEVSGSTTTKSYSGSLSAGDTITFRYVKDNSSHNYDDVCTFSYMQITTRKKVMITTLRESRARNIKKGYVGISNKARHITKGYVGVGGVARPIYSLNDKVEYYGTHPDGIYFVVSSLASANNETYVLFAGGLSGSSPVNHVNAFNSSLTRNTASTLNYTIYALAGASFGDYALFAGGQRNSSVGDNLVYVYDTALTKTTPCSLANMKWNLTGTGLSDCAIFAGGFANGITYNNVERISSDFTNTIAPSGLDNSVLQLASTTINGYAIFAGGRTSATYTSSGVSTVNAYDSSLTKRVLDNLSAERYFLKGTYTENFAMFTGGRNINGYSKIIDFYDTSLVHTVGELPSTKTSHCSTSFGSCAIVTGGANSNKTTYSISKSGTIEQCTDLSVGRYSLEANTIGNYALIAGGTDGDNYYKTVDIYTLL